jgi:hypothetical protein
MVPTGAVAFMSYVRSDDDHDSGRISELRQRLEGEIKMQTGRTFHIFQDRNDISWGQQWKERIEDALLDVTFLIPIVTPSYFQSYACKTEFEIFRVREKALGEDRLILPVYYVSCDEMGNGFATPNPVAEVLKTRNWADWRHLRFEPLTTPALRAEIASLATTIKEAMKELEGVFAAAKENKLAQSHEAPPIVSQPPLAIYSPEIPVARQENFSKERLERIQKKAYYVYTNKFDEIIAPADICQPAEIMSFHSYLLTQLRVANDSYSSEINANAAEISHAAEKQRLAMLFLIDNSGSMRGLRTQGVTIWMSIISNILSQANIANEVLGFTTRAWKGGQSRELWLADGKPPRPGRLNDLRYIVYKSFDQTFQEADTNFAVMLREGLLKENIDGEALLWAYSRIKHHPAERKIIFVLSDGAAVDDSTMSVNSGEFLQSHLIATINWLKTTTDVELYAIGISFDVSGYYGSGTPTLSQACIGPDLLRVVSLAAGNQWLQAGSIQNPDPSPDPPSPPRKRRRIPKGR